MLKKRLIPKLLIRHRQVGRTIRPVLVTTRQYRDVVEVGDPVSQAKIYEAQLADELMVLNIDGTPIREDGVMLDLIEKLAAETFMPLCVGGGVRHPDDFGVLLERGADKVSVNTAALERPEIIGQAAVRYGAQCVVVSIDYHVGDDGAAWVMSDGGIRHTGREMVAWAREAVDRGAGELVLGDVGRDGSGAGVGWELCREVARAVPVPVVLSNGCGLAEHFVQGFRDGLAAGVAAGTFFCFRDQNPMQTRSQIRNAGIPIRMET